MKKITSLLVFMTISAWLFAQESNEFTLTAQIPPEIVQNVKTDFIITIHKPYLQPFAMYEQQFPEGISVSEKNVGDGMFSYSDNTVSISWVRLPAAKTVYYTLSITADSTFRGKFSTFGILNYLHDNRNGVAFSDTCTVGVRTEKELKAGKTADNNQKTVIPSCSRIVRQDGNVFFVKLKFNEHEKMGTTRIYETIPAGYSVTVPKDKNGAQIIQSDNTLEFIWDKLNETNTDEVQYVLQAEKGNKKPKIQGEISFSFNGKVQRQEIKNK